VPDKRREDSAQIRGWLEAILTSGATGAAAGMVGFGAGKVLAAGGSKVIGAFARDAAEGRSRRPHRRWPEKKQGLARRPSSGR
jgi:hypothetical protein